MTHSSQNSPKSTPSVIMLGETENRGVYLLGIKLAQPCEIAFGRHNQGSAILVPAGDYLYTGSAAGKKGSSSLPARLMRHSSRSTGQPAHAIQPLLAEKLQAAGLPARIPVRKTVHWHIDYLLDETAAELFSIMVRRTVDTIEHQLADALAALPETAILSEGLGASDHPGGTHLLQVWADENWWAQLPSFLARF